MSDRLQTALEDCLQRVRRGSSVEQCLSAYPRLQRDLRPRLEAGATLLRQPKRTLSFSRKSHLRSRLMASMAQASRPRPRFFRWTRLALVPVAATAIAAVLVLGLRAIRAPETSEAATILTVLGGDVSVDSGHGMTPGWTGMHLRPGNRVLTAKDGRAVLTFFDGSTVTLDSETLVSIRSVSGGSSRSRVVISQQKGSTWTYAPQVLGPSNIEIETPLGRVDAPDEAAFSTDVEGDGRTVVGSHAGALEVTSGDARAAVTGGTSASIDSAGTLGPSAPAPSSDRDLVVRLTSVAFGYVSDPSQAVVGIVPAGVPVNQVRGATVTRSGNDIVIDIPDPMDGQYQVIFKSAGGTNVNASLGTMSTSLTASAADGATWSALLAASDSTLSFGRSGPLDSTTSVPTVVVPVRLTPPTATPTPKPALKAATPAPTAPTFPTAVPQKTPPGHDKKGGDEEDGKPNPPGHGD